MTIRRSAAIRREELGLLGELIELARSDGAGGAARADGYMAAAETVERLLIDAERDRPDGFEHFFDR